MLKPGDFLRHIPGEATSICRDRKEEEEDVWEMARYKLREFDNKLREFDNKLREFDNKLREFDNNLGVFFQKLGHCFRAFQGEKFGMEAVGTLTRMYRRVRYSKFGKNCRHCHLCYFKPLTFNQKPYLTPRICCHTFCICCHTPLSHSNEKKHLGFKPKSRQHPQARSTNVEPCDSKLGCKKDDYS